MTGEGVPTVLIVEDDPSLRLLCRVNLELENYRVVEAPTLTRAKELATAEELDVVLLDLHVGDQDGLEFLPTLRELCPDAAVCLLSGTSETDPPRLDGVSAFVRKPFELEELTGTVERLLAREPAQRH